jgi:hypothetical protein
MPKEHTIDPETGIWPIREWGPSCARGFVGNERFATKNDQVIKRTNRAVTKKWLKVSATRDGERKAS